MVAENLLLQVNFGNAGGGPIDDKSPVWAELTRLYTLDDPNSIVLMLDQSMLEDYPEQYCAFITHLKGVFPNSVVFEEDVDRLSPIELAGDVVIRRGSQARPEFTTDKWHRMVSEKSHSLASLEPLYEEKHQQQEDLGRNLVLEINFSNVKRGEPLDVNSTVWSYLNYLYLDGAPPLYIVLLSETPMWDMFPAEYLRFLSELHRLFPDATLYYHGRSDNHTQNRSCDVDVAKFQKGAVPPNGLWHTVTHAFQNIPMRKKLLLKVLGVAGDQAEDHFPARVNNFVQTGQFLCPMLHALWRNYVLRREISSLWHMRSWRVQQEKVKELPVQPMDSCLSAFFFCIKSSLSARFCETAKLFPEEAEEEKNAEDLDGIIEGEHIKSLTKLDSGLCGSSFWSRCKLSSSKVYLSPSEDSVSNSIS